jgi:hypothetical protein
LLRIGEVLCSNPLSVGSVISFDVRKRCDSICGWLCARFEHRTIDDG